MYAAASPYSWAPEYSGKQMVRGDLKLNVQAFLIDDSSDILNLFGVDTTDLTDLKSRYLWLQSSHK